MIVLNQLKSAKGIQDVASILNFKASALSYIVFKKNNSEKYTNFTIPKKSGGIRNICAPEASLKFLQRRLSDLLQICVKEINEANNFKGSISHGFTKDCSIVTNAVSHKNKRYVFNIDLKDFFGSINFGRVRGFFIKDRDFNLAPDVATLIAKIACHDNSLPQGSPCSPVISNLIGHILDIHLVRLAEKAGCNYTRYADDLTFSTNKPVFPSLIAKKIDGPGHEWELGRELRRLVKISGFEVNEKKTRMQYEDSRQEVTGLVVNKKINIRKEYRHAVRAMVHSLFTQGQFYLPHKVTGEDGASQIVSKIGTLNQLHGMLGFIDAIDIHNIHAAGDGAQVRKRMMYKRFLMFKDFYAATIPVIVCEGKTDNVYIRHAIRRLAKKFPRLATVEADGKIKLLVRIYKYAGTRTGKILGINGGTGELSNFIRTYVTESKKIKVPLTASPVIILVDNDSGATGKNKIFNTIKDVGKIKLCDGSHDHYHVINNLYVVPTPLNGAAESTIEGMFDDKTRSTVVGGKSFSDSNNLDTNSFYGKHVFAQSVINAHANEIDFSGFEKLLANIVDVIEAHNK